MANPGTFLERLWTLFILVAICLQRHFGSSSFGFELVQHRRKSFHYLYHVRNHFTLVLVFRNHFFAGGFFFVGKWPIIKGKKGITERKSSLTNRVFWRDKVARNVERATGVGNEPLDAFRASNVMKWWSFFFYFFFTDGGE